MTVNGVLWPACKVTGSEIPLRLKAVLLKLAAVTVTLAPLAVSFPDPVPLVPSTMLPIARVAGETASCPGEEEEFEEVAGLALLTPWQALSTKGSARRRNVPSPFCIRSRDSRLIPFLGMRVHELGSAWRIHGATHEH